jgi:hypothetical protein
MVLAAGTYAALTIQWLFSGASPSRRAFLGALPSRRQLRLPIQGSATSRKLDEHTKPFTYDFIALALLRNCATPKCCLCYSDPQIDR